MGLSGTADETMLHPRDRGAGVDELFARALEMPEEERGAFLAGACGEDLELRSAVHRMLRAAAEPDGLLETGAALKLAGAPGLADDGSGTDPARFRPGATLAHYEILDRLGAGGMGNVFVAQDTKLERKVALKVLPPEVARDPAMLKRFHREAKTVAALNHRSIVTLYSIEESEGVFFLTMELIGGETLDAYIPAGGLEAERILAITASLADALAAAHERGIAHRDLKPANVMIDADGRVKVLDFGLAKLHPAMESDPRESTETELTLNGAILGTLPYMSPEQLSGDPADHRTDLFSLGAILYEMCTGRRPFSGQGWNIVSAILRQTPQPVTETRDDLPEGLVRIVQRCLEKDPEDRYQTVRELQDELLALRRAADSGPEPSGAADRPRRAARAWWLAAAALGALAIAGLATCRSTEASDIARASGRAVGVGVGSR